MNYVKLFTSLLDSTLWSEPNHVRLVWITLLLKADKEGCVYTSVPGLARAANVTRAEVDEALDKFHQADPDSASPAFDGRRIESIDRGFKILNYETYNELKSAEDVREKARVRQANKRKRDALKIARGEWLEPDVKNVDVDLAQFCDRCRPDANNGGGACPKCSHQPPRRGGLIMASFNDAWRVWWGNTSPTESPRKASKAYIAAESEGHDLRGLVSYFEGLDKTGRDFCAALRGYVMGLQEVTEVAPEPARPEPEKLVVRQDPKPAVKLEVRQDRPAPAERPTLTRATGDDFDAAFDRIFAAWPMNSIAENAANARLAFGAAVDWYGLSFVTAKCLTAAKHIATLERKQGLKTYLTKSLAEEVKKKLAASTTDGGERRDLTNAEYEAMTAIATAAPIAELSFETIAEKCAEAGLPGPRGHVWQWSNDTFWNVNQRYGKSP